MLLYNNFIVEWDFSNFACQTFKHKNDFKIAKEKKLFRCSGKAIDLNIWRELMWVEDKKKKNEKISIEIWYEARLLFVNCWLRNLYIWVSYHSEIRIHTRFSCKTNFICDTYKKVFFVFKMLAVLPRRLSYFLFRRSQRWRKKTFMTFNELSQIWRKNEDFNTS